MLTPSNEIIQLLATFGPAFSRPTFENVKTLLYGVILAPGKRTVTAALNAMGLGETANFGKYHRVLNQARWSPWLLSRLLLGLLVLHFVAPGTRLVFLFDETLERRCGKKIVYKGWFRDAVRSTANKVVTSLGLRWLCVCLLVSVPWSQRQWALPFLVVPVLSEKTCLKLKKRPRSATWWSGFILGKLRSWYPDREIVAVGDGGFAAVELVASSQRLDIKFVARLRTDAQLFDFAGPQPDSKRGPKPKKGEVQPNLQTRLSDPKTKWTSTTLVWYGGVEKAIEFCTGVCLWYTQGQDPVPVRWVLVRYEETHERTGKVTVRSAAFFCSDTRDQCLSAPQILSWFVGRWNIEVTFEEVRAHLGFETQRHWSVRSIERTTPCLFGVFSLVVLMAKILYPTQLPVRACRWYRKEEATFSDVLGAVRSHLWSAMNYTHSTQPTQACLIPRAVWQQILQLACYAA